MARQRKNNIAKDIENYEQSRAQSGLNSIDALVGCCLIPDAKRRKQAVAEIVRQNSELRGLLDGNPKLLQSEVERTLLKMATGYTVTETTRRVSNGRVLLETKTKQIPPNQRAIEYYLNNRAADKWSGSPDGDGDEALARLDEILKGVRANAADAKAK